MGTAALGVLRLARPQFLGWGPRPSLPSFQASPPTRKTLGQRQAVTLEEGGPISPFSHYSGGHWGHHSDPTH